MIKKKQTEEELLQTHVLNLSEIRQAEENEKGIRNKKLPLFLIIGGFFCIATGFIFSGIINHFSSDSKDDKVEKELATGIRQENLICLSEFIDDSNSYKIVNKIVYYFDGSRLKSSKMNTEISFINMDDIGTIQDLTNNYRNLYSSVNGVTYDIYLKNATIYFNRDISNYSLFDISTYNPIISKLNHTNIFEGGEEFSSVKKKEILLGNSCS